MEYQQPDLLVCDEIGYPPLGQQGSNLFFHVISARHEQKSTIFTTNLPFAQWRNIFYSTTVATAIADRLAPTLPLDMPRSCRANRYMLLLLSSIALICANSFALGWSVVTSARGSC
jgi:IstB-like ATP binding protein